MPRKRPRPPINIRVEAKRGNLIRTVDTLRQVLDVTHVSRQLPSEHDGVHTFVEAASVRPVTVIGDPLFACPVCSATSTHPVDVAEGYCAACRDWTGPTPTDASMRRLADRDPVAYLAALGIEVDPSAGSISFRPLMASPMSPTTVMDASRALYRVAQRAQDFAARTARTDGAGETADVAALPQAGEAR